ncbi:MAG: hypothetical protein ABW221_13720 [Vicinamibacteria bacterium]
MSDGLTALFVLGLLLVGLAASLAALASAVWLIVIAFQTHVGWGLGAWLCYPFGAFAFVVQHWKRARWAGIVHFASMFLALAMLGAAELLEPTPPEDVTPAISATPSPAKGSAQHPSRLRALASGR